MKTNLHNNFDDGTYDPEFEFLLNLFGKFEWLGRTKFVQPSWKRWVLVEKSNFELFFFSITLKNQEINFSDTVERFLFVRVFLGFPICHPPLTDARNCKR